MGANNKGQWVWGDSARVRRLEALWHEGLSTAEIGRRMGITKGSVIGAAHRLKLPARPSPIKRNTGTDWFPVKAKREPKREPKPKQMKRQGPGRSPIVHTLEIAAALATPSLPSVPKYVERIRPSHPRGCQWHLARRGVNHFFCGAPIAPQGGSWCAEHRAIVFRPVVTAEARDAA